MGHNDRGVSFSVIIVCVAVLLAGVLGFLILWQHSRQVNSSAASPGPSATGPQPSAYFSSLEYADLRMSAAENFLGTTVTYLDGRVTNKGMKIVHRLDVELTFVDVLNQVVLRETAHPLTRAAAPLSPGETRPFRVAFEHLPVDWNQAPPTIKPLYVEF